MDPPALARSAIITALGGAGGRLPSEDHLVDAIGAWAVEVGVADKLEYVCGVRRFNSELIRDELALLEVGGAVDRRRGLRLTEWGYVSLPEAVADLSALRLKPERLMRWARLFSALDRNGARFVACEAVAKKVCREPPEGCVFVGIYFDRAYESLKKARMRAELEELIRIAARALLL